MKKYFVSIAGWSLLRVEGFYCSLDVLYGSLGISKLQCFIFKKWRKKIPAVNISQYLVIKTLEPDWIRNRIGIQPKMLDPNDPDSNETGSKTLENILVYQNRTVYSFFYISYENWLWVRRCRENWLSAGSSSSEPSRRETRSSSPRGRYTDSTEI